MQEGDVVIVAMPQANGVVKDRPAIILREMPPFRDMLVCGVSTQLRHAVKDFDEVISPADFVGSGLNDESLIRLGFLVVIAHQEIVGSIGSISSERHNRLLQMSKVSSEERKRLAGGYRCKVLARAYGDDEPEYSRDQIKEANAEYREGNVASVRATRCR